MSGLNAGPGLNDPLKREEPRGPVLWRDTAVGEPIIFIVEDDYRTRRFLHTVLRCETNARVIEASCPDATRLMAKTLNPRIDLLISEVEFADRSSGIKLAHEIVTGNPTTSVLLISLKTCPPHDALPAWRFLSIPFLTVEFLTFVDELSGTVSLRRGSAAGRETNGSSPVHAASSRVQWRRLPF